MPTTSPEHLHLQSYKRLSLDKLNLIPGIAWYEGMQEEWQPGEEGAQTCLQIFLENGLKGYKNGRNFPVRQNVSRLSPYLHFGEISPNDAWCAAKTAMIVQKCENDGEHFLSEMGWREFSIRFYIIFPAYLARICKRSSMLFPGVKTKVRLEPGSAVKRATLLLMQGCVNCGKQGICITVCG